MLSQWSSGTWMLPLQRTKTWKSYRSSDVPRYRRDSVSLVQAEDQYSQLYEGRVCFIRRYFGENDVETIPGSARLRSDGKRCVSWQSEFFDKQQGLDISSTSLSQIWLPGMKWLYNTVQSLWWLRTTWPNLGKVVMNLPAKIELASRSVLGKM